MEKLSKLIRGQDVFGHHVSLNFNKEASKHTTVLGGIMSIIVKVTMVLFTLLLLKRLAFYEDDKISIQLKIMNFTK